MKKVILLGAILLAGALATPPGEALSTANVRWVYNQVQITRGGRWVGAGNNTPVLSGAYVRTGYNSRAQINYADGSVMRLGSATIVRVREAVAKNVQVNRGKAYFKVAPQRQQMRVRTRTAVATVLGTEFVIEVKPAESHKALGPQSPALGSADRLALGEDAITQITTLDGLVGVSDANGGNMVQLPEGMTTFVGVSGPPQPPQEIDVQEFEKNQGDIGLDKDNDAINGSLDPSNPLARTNIDQNSPGRDGNLNTSPTTGNLELIIH